MKNRKKYEGVKLQVLRFEVLDIVTASLPSGEHVMDDGMFEKEDYLKEDIFG